ncbi:MAG: zinc transporter ZupT [Bacteroidales bacterium]|jgi:ZIP family zinc transporter|nr:zinc transporter ZupT [Bacteroidales bacterium]
MEHATWAFILTLFAGLLTGVGSLIAFFAKRTNATFLAGALGFSAGVMIYVSFVELFPEAISLLSEHHGKTGEALAVAAFFGGIILIAVIDKLVPSAENPHELKSVEAMRENVPQNKKLLRTSLLMAIVIAIHNFPEGIVTFATAADNLSLGVPVAIAIAIHNIPEGVSVSVPIYYATGDRKKAFWLSFASGLAEPLGALLAWVALWPFIVQSPHIIGYVSAVVAGIMVFISLDELLPAAKEYGKHHVAIYGVVGGMAVMAITLILL